MRDVSRIFILVLLVTGCRERLPETPRLIEARKLNSATTAPESHVRRAGAGTDALKKALTGGKLVFSDAFNRRELGVKWRAGDPHWSVVGNEVVNPFAENKGLWLLGPLPVGDVRIEFDARSDPYPVKGPSGDTHEEFPGDLKCEAFNKTTAHQQGYIFIFGGWQNHVNRIARLEEHGSGEGAQVTDGPPNPVKPAKTYRMKIVRVGSTIAFYADDVQLASFTDGEFIEGRHFGFNNWRAHVTFDNVAVYALDSAKPTAAKGAAPVKARGSAPAKSPNILPN